MSEVMKKVLVIKYVWIPVVISLVIFYLCCLIPTDDIPSVDFDWLIPFDKVVHFLMYFGLSAATGINYIHMKVGRIDIKKLFIYSIALPIAYGGFIEIIQNYFIANRDGDWFDFLADALGSFVALPVALVFRNYLIKNKFK